MFKSSHPTSETGPPNVCFFFSPAQAVFLVGRRMGRAGDGVLVWLRQSRGRVVFRRGRRGAVLVGAVALVRFLLRGLRRDLRGFLDVVRAASLGAMVDHRFGADPVYLLFSSAGQRRDQ